MHLNQKIYFNLKFNNYLNSFISILIISSFLIYSLNLVLQIYNDFQKWNEIFDLKDKKLRFCISYYVFILFSSTFLPVILINKNINVFISLSPLLFIAIACIFNQNFINNFIEIFVKNSDKEIENQNHSYFLFPFALLSFVFSLTTTLSFYILEKILVIENQTNKFLSELFEFFNAIFEKIIKIDISKNLTDFIIEKIYPNISNDSINS